MIPPANTSESLLPRQPCFGYERSVNPLVTRARLLGFIERPGAITDATYAECVAAVKSIERAMVRSERAGYRAADDGERVVQIADEEREP